MINIAICDDDIAMTTTIEDMLYKLGKEQVIKINCSVFFDGSTLVENISQETCYDLIYLDIEMQKINGINAAELIRDMEIPTLIIYISSYERYLKDLFNTEPFRFLSKPIDEKEFLSAFKDAYKRIIRKPEYFSFTYNKTFEKVLLNKVNYFESRNRVIFIHMARVLKCRNADSDKLECRFYGKINDIERQLSNSNTRFIRIHQSYLVNFDYIKSMNFTAVTMYDGTVLQISEDKRKNVRTQFCTIAGMEVSGNE